MKKGKDKRMEIESKRTRTHEGETKKKSPEQRKNARQLFSDVNEITRKLTRADSMVVENVPPLS